jgi:hypothetical protein
MLARISVCLMAVLLGVGPLAAAGEKTAAATSSATGANEEGAVTALPVTPGPADAAKESDSGPPVAAVGELPADMDALLHPPQFDYHGGGRDPFSPLVKTGGGEEAEPVFTDPGVADLVVVGLLWGGGKRFALVETPRGMGLVLRVGDRVRDGVVVEIGEKSVIFSQTAYGLTRRVTLPIGLTEEGRHER